MLTYSVYRASAQPLPSDAIDPAVSTVVFKFSFSVNVTVTDVVNFTCWQLDLYYLNSVLNCTGAVEGPFLNGNGAYGTFFGATINNNYNSTYGCLLAYDTIEGFDSVNGSGVILTVNFTAVGGDSSPLTLANTILGDNEIPPQPISHQDYSGEVIVTGGIHEVDVSAVSAKTVIGQGYSDNITATVANQGGYTETFNVTVYANATVVASQNVTLSNGNSTNITFIWNTASLAYGTYIVSTYTQLARGENNTANNNFTCGAVTVSIPGDVEGIFRVNMGNVVDILRAFGSTIGMPNYVANCDIANDGRIDMGDVIVALRDFGQHYP
jgi:hypothetical protein